MRRYSTTRRCWRARTCCSSCAGARRCRRWCSSSSAGSSSSISRYRRRSSEDGRSRPAVGGDPVHRDAGARARVRGRARAAADGRACCWRRATERHLAREGPRRAGLLRAHGAGRPAGVRDLLRRARRTTVAGVAAGEHRHRHRRHAARGHGVGDRAARALLPLLFLPLAIPIVSAASAPASPTIPVATSASWPLRRGLCDHLLGVLEYVVTE